jgi:hypothetical protein
MVWATTCNAARIAWPLVGRVSSARAWAGEAEAGSGEGCWEGATAGAAAVHPPAGKWSATNACTKTLPVAIVEADGGAQVTAGTPPPRAETGARGQGELLANGEGADGIQVSPLAGSRTEWTVTRSKCTAAAAARAFRMATAASESV